ncbi:glycosyl transferase, partial [Streptococcus oralis]|nr:glycosyl transferase [Streptococcus oralis]
AKREDTEAIGRAFDELLARENWPDLKNLSRAAQIYQPTEILKSEIHRLLGDKEK